MALIWLNHGNDQFFLQILDNIISFPKKLVMRLEYRVIQDTLFQNANQIQVSVQELEDDVGTEPYSPWKRSARNLPRDYSYLPLISSILGCSDRSHSIIDDTLHRSSCRSAVFGKIRTNCLSLHSDDPKIWWNLLSCGLTPYLATLTCCRASCVKITGIFEVKDSRINPILLRGRSRSSELLISPIL